MLGLRYKLYDLCWENDLLKCLWIMRKLGVKIMIMKVNVWCLEHEAWAWMWVRCIKHYMNRDKFLASHEWTSQCGQALDAVNGMLMMLWRTSPLKEWVASSH